MMKMVYPAIFTEEEGSYIVEFPDLEGCQSFGRTIEEAVEYAEEALTGYLLTLLEAEQVLAKPSDIKDIVPKEGFVTLISANVNQYRETKAVKKTLTIPSWLNNMAINKGINFSEVLKEALISKVGVSKIRS
jgi:predicted RNase H-like HicB family nuclease